MVDETLRAIPSHSLVQYCNVVDLLAVREPPGARDEGKSGDIGYLIDAMLGAETAYLDAVNGPSSRSLRQECWSVLKHLVRAGSAATTLRDIPPAANYWRYMQNILTVLCYSACSSRLSTQNHVPCCWRLELFERKAVDSHPQFRRQSTCTLPACVASVNVCVSSFSPGIADRREHE